MSTLGAVVSLRIAHKRHTRTNPRQPKEHPRGCMCQIPSMTRGLLRANHGCSSHDTPTRRGTCHPRAAHACSSRIRALEVRPRHRGAPEQERRHVHQQEVGLVAAVGRHPRPRKCLSLGRASVRKNLLMQYGHVGKGTVQPRSAEGPTGSSLARGLQLVSSKCDPREGEGGSRGRVKAYFMYLAT